MFPKWVWEETEACVNFNCLGLGCVYLKVVCRYYN